MDINLIIDDDYVTTVGLLCKNRGNELESILDTYMLILQEIEDEALTAGEISTTLNEYRSCVELLNDQIDSISKDIKTMCNNFISAVNVADDYLF